MYDSNVRRFILILSLFCAAAVAQTNPAARAAREWRIGHERAIMDEYVTLLAIPDIAGDRLPGAHQCRGHQRAHGRGRRPVHRDPGLAEQFAQIARAGALTGRCFRRLSP